MAFQIEDRKLIKYFAEQGEQEVNIPEGVTRIENYAFEGNDNITSVVIPNTVTHLGGAAFSKCSNLKDITIPSSVKTVGQCLFEGCVSLESVILPDGITQIPGLMFRNCSSITNICIPNSVTVIDFNAFAGCTSLKNIDIPEGVTDIGSVAFYNCSSLERISIPDSVKFEEYKGFKYEPFRDCNSIKEIILTGSSYDKSLFKEIPEPNILTALSVCISDLPSKFRTAAAIGFILADVNGTQIKEGIRESYRKYLVRYHKNLFDKIDEIPEILIYLLKEEMIKPEEVDQLLKEDHGTDAKAMLLDYNNSKTVKKSRQKLEEAEEKALFRDKPTIADLKKTWSFSRKPDGTYILEKYKGNDTEIKIPAEVGKSFFSEIKMFAFEYQKFVCVVIPDSVTSIGKYAFCHCKNLKSITLPNGLIAIQENTFAECRSIETINVPDTVKSIGNWAFQNCYSLKSIVIPNGVEKIGLAAFSNCKGLESIVIPNSVKTIASGAFDFCSNLTIKAMPGSYAEQYAKDNNIRFEAL